MPIPIEPVGPPPGPVEPWKACKAHDVVRGSRDGLGVKPGQGAPATARDIAFKVFVARVQGAAVAPEQFKV